MSMIRKLRPMAPRSRCIARYWATWGITYILALTLAAELAASEKAIASPPSSSGSHDSLRSVWPMRLKHGFHQALERGLGFSFVLDGQRIGSAVPADSSVTTRERDGVHETLFRHPLGLVAVRQCRRFPHFDAVEYTIKLRNESPTELPILEDVNALDVSFRGQSVEDSSIVSCGGGGADSRFPPKDYALARSPVRSTNELTLSSEGGYPSNSSMPFFFIENETTGGGIYVAIGWTGNWEATIEADSADDSLHIRGGMPRIHIKLRPGEEISGPTVLLGCYQGRLEDGANALRRFIRHCCTPSVAGQPLVAPIMHTTWISDATAGASIIRFHLEGLNHIIPGSRQLVAFAPAEHVFAEPDVVFPDIDCQCCFAGAFGTAGKLHRWPEAMKQRTRKHVEVYKKLRRYLAEDFYLLIPQSQTLDTWAGWQFHDPPANEGFVQVFRIESPRQSNKIVLKGLDPNGEYELTDPYAADSFTASGAELTSIGFDIGLAKNSSRVFIYRATKSLTQEASPCWTRLTSKRCPQP
jgi:hypothetical protein